MPAWFPAATWAASLVLLLSCLALAPVTRTQEARVLVTARETLAAGGQQWLIPRMNGRLRLEKPPLAYWLSAGAFAALGENEFAGRLPAALAGWAMLGVVYRGARRKFGNRAAWFAAAMLLGCMLFFRQAQLAETDIFAALFVTASIFCIWLAADEPAHDLRWHGLSGVMIGMAAFSKGPSALMSILFWILLAAWRRHARLLLRWLLSGAPLIAAVTGGAWFVYLYFAVGLETVRYELNAAARGIGHSASPLAYIPYLARATLPLTVFFILAGVAAARVWWKDQRLQTAAIWFVAMFLPLCVIGQRQYHYLLVALPPMAIVAGWWIDGCLAGTARGRTALRYMVMAMAVIALSAAPAIPLLGHSARGEYDWSDWALASFLVGAAVASGWLAASRRLESAAVAWVAATPIISMLLLNAWLPSRDANSTAGVARQLRSLSDGPYYIYGEDESITLAWELRRIVPRVLTVPELSRLAAEHPDLLVVCRMRKREPAEVLPGFIPAVPAIALEDHRFQVYRSPRQ